MNIRLYFYELLKTDQYSTKILKLLINQYNDNDIFHLCYQTSEFQMIYC